MRSIPFVATVALLLTVLTSCGVQKIVAPKVYDIQLMLETDDIKPKYTELDKGLRFNVVSSAQNSQILDMTDSPSWMTGMTGALSTQPKVSVTPPIRQFVQESISKYARKLGIPVNTSMTSDYVLNISVDVFKVRVSSNMTTATVSLEYSLYDADNNLVVAPTTVSGRKTRVDKESYDALLSSAYRDALDNIDWNRIASYLKIHERAEQEKQRAVVGLGDTALEHTIIRWYIVSSPQGADVSWRVVSSTPDVKNTNSVYLGTTPYESTESFDIKGLSFQNSGDVQIEITCERPGYLPQKRRFNLRQAIEQKEISAKFNLVKEE